MEIATGGLIDFVDSDAHIAPEFIARLHEAMVATGAQVAEYATDYVDEDRNVLRLRNAADVKEMDKIETLRRLI